MRLCLSPKHFLSRFYSAVTLLTFLKLTFEHGWPLTGPLSGLHQAPVYRFAALIILIACAEWFRGSDLTPVFSSTWS